MTSSLRKRVLLDRLVRQGRAFRIHVLLGSQTIGGSSGLSEANDRADGRPHRAANQRGRFAMILGDNNSARVLLSRPGEAIYNDQGGLSKQTAHSDRRLPDDRREQ